MQAKKSLAKVNDSTIRKNLRTWFDRATPEDIREGKNWYRETGLWIKMVANIYGESPFTVAAVLSALSPQNPWERNKIDCVRVLEGWRNGHPLHSFKVCTFHSNKEKAYSILSGDRIMEFETGRKTFSFCQNLAYQDKRFVTVDIWHVRACLTVSRKAVDYLSPSITDKQYDRIAKITLDLATEKNLDGFVYQAIVWTAIRNQWNTTTKGYTGITHELAA